MRRIGTLTAVVFVTVALLVGSGIAGATTRAASNDKPTATDIGVSPTEIRIAVVADTESPTPPCGPCRQILWEFAGDLDVVLANMNIVTATHRLSDLLPHPFDRRLLR